MGMEAAAAGNVRSPERIGERLDIGEEVNERVTHDFLEAVQAFFN